MIPVVSHTSCFQIIFSVNISVTTSELEQFSISEKKLLTEWKWGEKKVCPDDLLPPLHAVIYGYKADKLFRLRDIYLDQGMVAKIKIKLDSAL